MTLFVSNSTSMLEQRGYKERTIRKKDDQMKGL